MDWLFWTRVVVTLLCPIAAYYAGGTVQVSRRAYEHIEERKAQGTIGTFLATAGLAIFVGTFIFPQRSANEVWTILLEATLVGLFVLGWWRSHIDPSFRPNQTGLKQFADNQ